MAFVRARREDDLPACMALIEDVHKSDAYPTVLPDDPLSWINPRGTLRAWVAEVESRVVGHIALRSGPEGRESTWSQATGLPGEKLTVVTRFLVASDSRRIHAGAQLFDAACVGAENLGLTPVLDVLEKNRDAIKLYEGRGWTYISSTLV